MRFIPAVSPVQIQSPLPCTGEMHRISPVPRLWPVGQVVKTRPFHGCNMGSSPVRVTNGGLAQLVRAPASHAGGHWFESSSLHQKRSSPYGGLLFLSVELGLEQSGGPQTAKNMPVACFLARGSRVQQSPPKKKDHRKVIFSISILPVAWDRCRYYAAFSTLKPRLSCPHGRSCQTSDPWSAERRRTSCPGRSSRPPYWAADTPL